MEWATLGINAGLLIAAVFATLIAWQQARRAAKSETAAGRASELAQEARSAAAAAQAATAHALAEANEIARAAKSAQDAVIARSTERHHVEWEVLWDWEPGRWFLANRGPDVPTDVRITVNASLIGRVVESEAEVRVGEGVYFEFPIQFQGGAGVPTVDWRVEWLSDLGTPHSDSGQWP